MDIIYMNIAELRQGETKLSIKEKEREMIRESLEKLGFVAPVLIDENKTIIDGNNRVEIAREIDENSMIPCVVIRDDEEKKKLISLYMNTARRHLTDTQLFEILPVLYASFSQEARMRQSIKHNIPEAQKGTTFEKIAEVTGRSDETIRKAIAIQKKAPELVDEIREKKLSIDKAYKQVKEKEKKETLQQFNAEENVIVSEDGEKRKEIFSLVSSIRNELMSNGKANITQTKTADISLRILNASMQIVENINVFEGIDKEKIEEKMKELLKITTEYFKSKMQSLN